MNEGHISKLDGWKISHFISWGCHHADSRIFACWMLWIIPPYFIACASTGNGLLRSGLEMSSGSPPFCLAVGCPCNCDFVILILLST